MAQGKSSPLASGIAGAIIGAAAAAAAIVLSDEKNREKAEKVLANLQKQGDKVLKEITRRALELREKEVKNIAKLKKVAKKLISKRPSSEGKKVKAKLKKK